VAESPRLNRGRGADTTGLEGGRGTWNFRWSGKWNEERRRKWRKGERDGAKDREESERGKEEKD